MTAQHYTLDCLLPVPRERAWEILADTDQLNERLGLPPVAFAALHNSFPPDTLNADTLLSAGSSLGRPAAARVFGLPLHWTEYPFEWVRGKSYTVARSYEDGGLREFRGGVQLHDDISRGTRAHLWADIVPRSFLSAPIMAAYARHILHRTRRYCEALCAPPTTSEASQMETARHFGHHNLSLFAAKLRALEATPCAPDIVRRLERHLRGATNSEACNIRPYELAEEWGLERDAVLRACLHGARLGLLSLRWNLMCPHCRVPKATYETLGQMEKQFHCDWCGVAHEADFAHSVELRFAMHPGIRRTKPQMYCMGSPAHLPHILAQTRLMAGAAACLVLPDDAGPLRLRILRANHILRLTEASSTVAYGADGWHADLRDDEIPDKNASEDIRQESKFMDGIMRIDEIQETAKPNLAVKAVRVRNESEGEIMVALEREARDAHAVTAARVTAMPEFRAQFGSEVLMPGTQIDLEHAGILFSDLRASTAFYERAGDAPAYNWVRNHFEVLERCVGDCGGAVVKTMGDAIMAVFVNGKDALRAAMCMHDALRPPLEDARAQSQFTDGISSLDGCPALKIGVHCGPAIVVNTDGRLDYFGRSINIAARLQHMSAGDDIVVSDACHAEAERDPEIARRLARYQAHPHRVTLRGFEESFDVWTLRSAPEDSHLASIAYAQAASFDPHAFDAMLDALRAA